MKPKGKKGTAPKEKEAASAATPGSSGNGNAHDPPAVALDSSDLPSLPSFALPEENLMDGIESDGHQTGSKGGLSSNGMMNRRAIPQTGTTT